VPVEPRPLVASFSINKSAPIGAVRKETK